MTITKSLNHLLSLAPAFALVTLITSAAAAPAPQVIDSDADGVQDKDDKCPMTPPSTKVDVNGCPLIITPSAPPAVPTTLVDADKDGDKIPDAKDACPDKAGVPSKDPKKNGCPLPKPTGGNTGGTRQPAPKCGGVEIPQSNLAIAFGKTIWEGPDGAMPPTDLKCPEGQWAAIIGSVAKASDQQCFEYYRSKSLTTSATWEKGGQRPVHAVNVTPNIGKARAWCVSHSINPEEFDLMDQFISLLKDKDWKGIDDLLKIASFLTTLPEALRLIQDAQKNQMDEINTIKINLETLKGRVETLENRMTRLEEKVGKMGAKVEDHDLRKFSLDLGVAGYISPYMIGGTNMAYAALGKVALNFVFGEKANWIARPALGVGMGYDRVPGIELVFELSFLKILNSGSVNLGPMVRGSTNILLNGPTGAYASDSNAGGGGLLRWYLGPSHSFFLEASGALGGKIQNCPRGGYCAQFGGDALLGFGGTIR